MKHRVRAVKPSRVKCSGEIPTRRFRHIVRHVKGAFTPSVYAGDGMYSCCLLSALQLVLMGCYGPFQLLFYNQIISVARFS